MATSELKLWDLINQSVPELSPAQERLWDAIRIVPAKWQQHPWGDADDGFWAVAIFGQRVLWHNHIEGGFDISPYRRHGEIGVYSCSQYELRHAMELFWGIIKFGYGVPYSSPPIPGEYPGR